MWHWKLQEHESRKSQSSDHDTITWKNILRLHKTGDKEKFEQMLFSSSWIEIAWLWLRWWIVQLLTSSRLFPLFLGWKCATSPRSEEWNGMAVKTAEHDVFQFYLERNFFLLFLNIEKVLQTTATTNGSETHSCQPKSRAAKSKWAKIETGLSLGNRWEMFYFMAGLRRGRARRRRHQLRTTFVRLGELVASIRRQFMSFCFTDVHPISCSSFFSLFAVCILINIIGSVWWPSYDRKLCIMLRMDFARHRTKKTILFKISIET